MNTLNDSLHVQFQPPHLLPSSGCIAAASSAAGPSATAGASAALGSLGASAAVVSSRSSVAGAADSWQSHCRGLQTADDRVPSAVPSPSATDLRISLRRVTG